MINLFKKKKTFPPWLKGTNEGKLYIDTSNKEWQEWFVNKIKEFSKYKIINGKFIKIS